MVPSTSERRLTKVQKLKVSHEIIIIGKVVLK